MAMTPAEKQRKYRERKRAEAAAAAAAAEAERNAAGLVPGTETRDAVEETIAAAKWLTAADAASIAQARTLAKRIDVLEFEGETTKALSAHRALSQVLNDLGATATKRLQYELRSRRAAAQEEDGDGERQSDEGKATGTGGNVTPLRRPPRRRDT